MRSPCICSLRTHDDPIERCRVQAIDIVMQLVPMGVVGDVKGPSWSEVVGLCRHIRELLLHDTAHQPCHGLPDTYPSSRSSRHEPHHSTSGHVRAKAVICSNGKDASSSTRWVLTVCFGDGVNNGVNACLMGSRFLAAEPVGQMHACVSRQVCLPG